MEKVSVGGSGGGIGEPPVEYSPRSKVLGAIIAVAITSYQRLKERYSRQPSAPEERVLGVGGATEIRTDGTPQSTETLGDRVRRLEGQ